MCRGEGGIPLPPHNNATLPPRGDMDTYMAGKAKGVGGRWEKSGNKIWSAPRVCISHLNPPHPTQPICTEIKVRKYCRGILGGKWRDLPDATKKRGGGGEWKMRKRWQQNCYRKYRWERYTAKTRVVPDQWSNKAMGAAGKSGVYTKSLLTNGTDHILTRDHLTIYIFSRNSRYLVKFIIKIF